MSAEVGGAGTEDRVASTATADDARAERVALPHPVVPVTILTGFLGAGKTTLLNHLLHGNHGLRIAVMVNDFGDINIDAMAVARVEAGLVALTNGCICCDKRGDLRLSMMRLVELPQPPEYIVVEASGISDPRAIADTFLGSELRERLRIDSIVALVDAENVRDWRLDQQLIRDQLRLADLIVLNKIDTVSEATRDALESWIRSIAPAARIATAVQAQLPLDLILPVVEDRRATFTTANWTPDHAHHHSAEYERWSWASKEPLDLHRTVEVLKNLPASVFRAKGYLHLRDAPRLRFGVQIVGRRMSTDVMGDWADLPPGSQLVFIGLGTMNTETLQHDLARCIA